MVSTKYQCYFFLLTTMLSYGYACSNITDINNISNGNTTCHLCQDIVQIIDAEIRIANGSIAIIEDVVRAFCHTLLIPASKTEWLYILSQLQNIINWLIHGISPKDICIKLGLCQS